MHGFVAFWIGGGTLNSLPVADGGAVSTMGYIGMFNYGGSQSNLGPYGVGSAPPNVVEWPSVYVNEGTQSGGSYYYFYEYRGETWVDASSVASDVSGNIFVS